MLTVSQIGRRTRQHPSSSWALDTLIPPGQLLIGTSNRTIPEHLVGPLRRTVDPQRLKRSMAAGASPSIPLATAGFTTRTWNRLTWFFAPQRVGPPPERADSGRRGLRPAWAVLRRCRRWRRVTGCRWWGVRQDPARLAPNSQAGGFAQACPHRARA